MAYTADTLEEFAYDFTGITRQDGKGKCKGKGSIPEPSEDALTEFMKANAEAAVQMMGGNVSAQALMANPKKIVDLVSASASRRKETEKLLAKLCQNSPSADELSELPLRQFNGFANWLTEEVGSPTRATGATSL